jgi:hypothetical protein
MHQFGTSMDCAPGTLYPAHSRFIREDEPMDDFYETMGRWHSSSTLQNSRFILNDSRVVAGIEPLILFDETKHRHGTSMPVLTRVVLIN